jgi:hypothetical protein
MLGYGDAMNDAPVSSATAESAESALRASLARGDETAGAIAPILRRLLVSDHSSLFCDEIVARVRGMLDHVARQLLDRLAAGDGVVERIEHDPDRRLELVEALVADSAFMAHVHALALEFQLTERLQLRLSLDPVLSPLLQALIASADGATAEVAMKLLASQARFCQAQRRMQLPLAELPADLLHAALLLLRSRAGAEGGVAARAAAAEAAIREQFDESRSRIGLIARLLSGLGGGAAAALSVSHAGAAIFLSALAHGSGQDRDYAVVSTNESQLARLALALRAAGLKPASVEGELLALHPDFMLPAGFERLGADRAAGILAVSGSWSGA